jgi:hypothetical protein
MDEVKTGAIYRHFKGNYYYVESVAYDSETMERRVVYRPLYDRGDGKNLWVSPESIFLQEIPKRADNITGQKVRFEYQPEYSKDHRK